MSAHEFPAAKLPTPKQLRAQIRRLWAVVALLVALVLAQADALAELTDQVERLERRAGP